MQKGKMRIYGCGGCGVNIASEFAKQTSDALGADINVTLVDTSRSNMKPSIEQNQTYLLENLDGSGKVRSENYTEIMNVVKDILLKHKPLDFNVVVMSASGGSGSVIGPLIISELLTRDLPVVAVVVGSDESVISANNTLNTLKSLEGVSQKTGRPVVMFYRHNQRGRPRSVVDVDLKFSIAALAILCSRQIQELDSMDIANWLRFDKTTSARARLAGLEILDRTEAAWNEYTALSVISIYRNPDEPIIPVTPEYSCFGYAELNMGDVKNMHYLVDVDLPARYGANIRRTLDELEEARRARPNSSSLVSDKDNLEDSGMVL